MISDKDKDAAVLVEKGIENLGGIKTMFDEIIGNPLENTRNSLKTLKTYRTKHYTLEQLLLTVINSISDFLSVIHQVVEMENGK